LERQLRAGSVLPGLFPGFNPWSMGSSQAPTPPPAPPVGGSASENADLAASVRQLQEQVKALEKRRSPTARRKK